jgi:hypothetical protein
VGYMDGDGRLSGGLRVRWLGSEGHKSVRPNDSIISDSGVVKGVLVRRAGDRR